jgi:hypothetical protein
VRLVRRPLPRALGRRRRRRRLLLLKRALLRRARYRRRCCCWRCEGAARPAVRRWSGCA